MLASVAQQRYNILPELLLSVGGATACDQKGFMAAGLLYMLETEFLRKPLSAVKHAHVSAFMEYEWDQWCTRALERADVPANADVATTVSHMLRACEADERTGYKFRADCFHGVLSASRFQESFRSWAQAGERCTHYAIIAVSESAGDASVDAQEL